MAEYWWLFYSLIGVLLLSNQIIHFGSGEILPASSDNLEHFDCGKRWECSKRLDMLYLQKLSYAIFFRDYNCYCDSQCEYYGDCCNRTEPVFLEASEVSERYFHCVLNMDINPLISVYIIDTCPRNYIDQKVKEQCESSETTDILNRVPVTGADTGLLYKNMYCSICHREEFRTWLLSVSCYSNNPIVFQQVETSSFLSNDQCDVQFSPQKGDVYRPCQEYISTCPEIRRDDTSEKCYNTGFRSVYMGNVLFKNKYCALCNNKSLDSVSCFPTNITTFGIDKRTRKPYSFRMLLDMREGLTTTLFYKNDKQYKHDIEHVLNCTAGHMYDPFNNICREIVKYEARQNETSVHNSSQCPGGTQCSNNFVSCESFIALNQDEYVESGGNYITILATGEQINSSSYFMINGKLHVCSGVFEVIGNRRFFGNNTEIMFNFSEAEAFVSLCGVVVSLISLMLTIAVYIYFPSLRNIPGKNLLSLASLLFTAELLFLIAPLCINTFVLCKSVATVMHFCFLAAFFWMNVMSFDIWFTFSRTFVKAGEGGKSSKRFRAYCVYAMTVPVILVTIALFLDQDWIETNVRPNYGLCSCWICNTKALVLFFGAPLFIILLCNTAWYILTAWNLCIAKRNSVRVSDEKRSNFLIYVKLSVIMGLTWLFGFIANLSSSEILWYFFIILNTSQGLFIFLSFTCSKKVLFLLRDRYSRLKTERQLSRGTTKSSSNTMETRLSM